MGAQKLGLFDSFLRELAIRRKLRELRECEAWIKLAVKRGNDARWLLASQERKHAELKAELIKLESPDDVVRRGQQA
jgi:hypothetical protein